MLFETNDKPVAHYLYSKFIKTDVLSHCKSIANLYSVAACYLSK